MENKENKVDNKPTETDAEKIARIEQALAEKDETIKTLQGENEGLKKKINSLKIDGLVRQVDPKVVKDEEPIVFDFTL